ncbi:FAD-binding protein [Geovibrio thiophilus]|uniref:FAD-binding protein n=1 Tax=Geovibrio thiophilus TaxID=139438 RepID=A0A3R5Y821_9BACT|nr:FAD-binding protein [Geovibrio thiophilus]QAR33927.1 FAD-binding protein [Geovibrio thiophilus]
MSISRRNFIKKATVVAGAATIGAMLPDAVNAAPVQVPKKWDYETEIVVVGFGGAGACAAIEAANAGTSSIILEKQVEKTHYPNSRMSGGIFHSTVKEYKREALKQYALALFSGQNLPWKLESEEDPIVAEGLADLWADYIPNIIPWLQSIDPAFKPTMGSFVSKGASFPDFPGAKDSGYSVHTSSFSGYTRSMTGTKDLPYMQKEYGEAFFALLKKGVDDRKNKIRVFYESPAVDLVQNNKGEIIGVLADQKGKTISVKAKKAVILTCGGYEYNFEMRRAFLEGQGTEGWAFYGTTANTGDGISMAMKVGAGLAKVGKAASRLIAAPPVRHNGLKIGIITPAVGRPHSIMVNAFGDRYLAETKITDDPSRYFSYKEAVRFNIDTLRYPNSPSWLIMDQQIIDAGPLTNMAISTSAYDFLPWTADNQDAIKRGWIMKADTLQQLAQMIKNHPENKEQMVPENLEAAVKKFNEACAAGEDKEFGRRKVTLKPVEKAPYYAMPLYAGGPNTKGGIKCNEKRQVLEWTGKVIPHLYTAGEISSALKFVYQGGGNITECVVMGRAAGRNAADEKPL